MTAKQECRKLNFWREALYSVESAKKITQLSGAPPVLRVNGKGVLSGSHGQMNFVSS